MRLIPRPVDSLALASQAVGATLSGGHQSSGDQITDRGMHVVEVMERLAGARMAHICRCFARPEYSRAYLPPILPGDAVLSRS